MAELTSLYTRISIDQNSLKYFLAGSIPPVSHYDDWIPWLEGQHYYGNLSAEEVLDIDYPDLTVGQYLERWLEDSSFPGNGRIGYNKEGSEWELSLLQFSENYSDYVAMLNVLRSIDRYLGSEDEGFIMIYDFFFGDKESNTVIEIKNSESIILPEVPERYLQVTHESLQGRITLTE
ncbi:hypothetical protein [Fodinibius salsisoli]|uniref:Uncharacterized protein n=1 Tax=Fodinibius salsisoli TaxID=2820877 RepID=A0ABT3PHH4_9BACT|nr:hypothetical protein [Fodinibius salsisoli]MCW9705238.1 hypothetical protein [Fodinibius salsisoli]